MAIDGIRGVSVGGTTAPRWSEPNAWLGLVLVAAAITELVGAYARYATARLSGDPVLGIAPTNYSYSLIHGLSWWGVPGFAATLLVTAIVGGVFAFRPSRGNAALVLGFTAAVVGGVAYTVLKMARTSGRIHFGPGFFVILAAFIIEASVAISLFVALWISSDANDRADSSTTRMAFVCAVLLGASTAVAPVVGSGQSLAWFSPLSAGSGVVAVVAFATLAAVPLLASRLGGPTGARIFTGLAAMLFIELLDTLNRRIGSPFFFQRFTIGWWIDLTALALVVGLRRRLRRSDPSTPRIGA